MEESSILKIYTGSEISAILLKGILENNGIGVIMKNEFQQGLNAGFGAGIPSTVDLFIQDNDIEKATILIKKFSKENE